MLPKFGMTISELWCTNFENELISIEALMLIIYLQKNFEIVMDEKKK